MTDKTYLTRRLADRRDIVYAMVWEPGAETALVARRDGGLWVASHGVNLTTRGRIDVPAGTRITPAVVDALDAVLIEGE